MCVRVSVPLKISPCQTTSPAGESLWIATSCGIPASLFVNLIWNGTPAGAVRSALSNAMPEAVSSRTVPVAPPDAAGEAAGLPEGAPLGAPLAAGAPLAPALGAADGDAKASFQQLGTGVEPGAGAKVGSRQPFSVVVRPVAGSIPSYASVEGARTNATSSSTSR